MNCYVEKCAYCERCAVAGVRYQAGLAVTVLQSQRTAYGKLADDRAAILETLHELKSGARGVSARAHGMHFPLEVCVLGVTPVWSFGGVPV